MKTFLSIILTLIATTAFGAPFLAVDFDANHDQYILEFDGQVYQASDPIEHRNDNTETVTHDLGTLITPKVIHTVRLKAISPYGEESGWSDPLEFMLSETGTIVLRQTPASPKQLRLLSE